MDGAARDEIVRDSLRQLDAGFRLRDLEGTLALFSADSVVFGSGEHENAFGADQLREFLARIFARPHAYGWSDFEPLYSGGTDELIWFLAPTAVTMTDDDGAEERVPYRVSGVLQLADDGRWLLRLFNGSVPDG